MVIAIPSLLSLLPRGYEGDIDRWMKSLSFISLKDHNTFLKVSHNLFNQEYGSIYDTFLYSLSFVYVHNNFNVTHPFYRGLYIHYLICSVFQRAKFDTMHRLVLAEIIG